MQEICTYLESMELTFITITTALEHLRSQHGSFSTTMPLDLDAPFHNEMTFVFLVTTVLVP